MRIVIAGAGIGGMTLAALLHRFGHEVELVEKAGAFGEVGAGIQLSPNGTRVLAAVGLADDLAHIGTTPDRVVLRRWEDDAELLTSPMGNGPAERHGHPYYNVYRPDLMEVLATALGDVTTRFGAEVIGATNHGGIASIDLADGSVVEADVVVGADGIHSSVRGSVFGASPSRFSGSVAYRALIPRDRVADLPVEVTNRMGPQSHLVSYFVGRDRRYLNLVCVVPEGTWDVEGWNEPGSVDELRSQFVDWSPTVNRLLQEVIEPVHRWALYDRPPIETWSRGRITLLGDACHAMLPFMAQGACQAIEDAAVLSRLLSSHEPTDGSAARIDVPAALDRYQRIRQPRAAELQRRSWRNATVYHLPDGPEQRTRDAALAEASMTAAPDAFDWLHGYDAMTVDLD